MNASANKSDWARLLLALYRQGGEGLSLPFLVGARTVIDPGYVPATADARFLLQEVFQHGVEQQCIRIFWCSFTKAYVLGLAKTEAKDGVYISAPATVYAIDLVCEEFGESSDEIIEGLTGLYAEEISNQTFSVSNGRWGAFNEKERSFIISSLKED